MTDIDFVARAEDGKEVEELMKKQLFKSIRDKVPVNKVLQGMDKDFLKDLGPEPAETDANTPTMLTPELKKQLLKYVEQLVGTRAAFLLDKEGKLISKMPLGELSLMIQDYPETVMIVADAKINQDLVDLGIHRRIKCLAGTGLKDEVKTPKSLVVVTPEELKSVA